MNLVSVIMPAYNAGHFISEAIESVLKQSYKDWDLTIVNDGSDDNTKVLIERYIEKYNDKIKLIDKEKNEGTASGLNTLVDAVNGKYICWLSADDAYTPCMLEDSVKFLENNKEFDLVFSDYETMDENSDFLQNSVFKKVIEELKDGRQYQPYRHLLVSGCCIHGCTVMAKSSCFKTVGKFNQKYKYAQDYDMWLRMASLYNIGYIDKIHVKGREYSWQISKQGNNELDAIDVLFDFIHNKEKFRDLYKKSGFYNDNEAVCALVTGQLKEYKHRNKEFEYLIKKLFNDTTLEDFWKCDAGKELHGIISKLKTKEWYLSEEVFKDNTEKNYLYMLCELNNIDAFIINNQAIRFDRFEGNSLERFNKGLMRSNDIIIGKVSREDLIKFIDGNKSEYRYILKNKTKDELLLGISYFMYKKTNITDTLNMASIIDTGQDIWWQLCKHIMN